MKSIQTKLIALILSGIIICAFIIGGAGVLSAQSVIDKNSAQYMNSLCREKSLELDSLFGRIEQSVDTMAEYALGQLESLDELISDAHYLDEFNSIVSEFAITAANNTDGAIGVYIRYNPDIAPANAGIFYVRGSEDEPFSDFELTDLSLYEEDDVEHVGWYYIPVKAGKPVWLTPYLNKNTGVTMISYVVPLYEQDKLLGVAGMDIDFDYISNVVSEIKIYDSGSAVLADAEGNVLVHDKECNGYEEQADFGVHLAVAASVNQSDENLYRFSRNGIDSKMTVNALSNGMSLAITAPVSEIDSEKNQLVANILIAAVVIAALFTAMTVLIARRTIIRPILQLNDAAKKIADGDLNFKVDCSSKDEIGTLAKSFSQTAKSLKKNIDYINGLAFVDSLTGVNNNTAYQRDVLAIDEEIENKSARFAVAVVDINDLKLINDTCGHDSGNKLISTVANLVCDVFGREHVYRIGGDEFAVIIRGDETEKCSQYAAALESESGSKTDDFFVSFAKGIAVYDSSIDANYESVFIRADREMYKNKTAMKEHGEGSKHV